MNSRRFIDPFPQTGGPHLITSNASCCASQQIQALDFRNGSKADIAQSKAMSALPPKADIRGRASHVRFVPKAEVAVIRISGIDNLNAVPLLKKVWFAARQAAVAARQLVGVNTT
jgi:hypothetical protein